jgi:glycosyltransferase involved in cell wall biosynthesis
MDGVEKLGCAKPAPPPRAGSGRRPVRVLHCVGHLARGGIENWLFQLVQRLGRDRYEHHVVVWTDEEEAFTAQFRAAGVRVLPCAGHTNPLRLRREVSRIVRDHGPYDVLHTHGSHGHAFAMLFAAAAGIRARVAHSHTDVRPVLRGAGAGYRLYAAAGNRLMRSLATVGVGVTGEAAASLFGPRWREGRKVRIVHCGIDLAPFARPPDPELRDKLGLPPDRAVVGHVGRFEPQKNHFFLLDLAEELARRGSRLHFLLIGDGSLRREFTDRMRQRGIEGFFTIVEDCLTVPAHMVGAMDCFICPSLYEGLPLVAIEAQAAGLGCLVSEGTSRDVGLHPPLVRRMALERGVEAWADAIERMPALRMDNRDPALRRVLEGSSFNVETSAAGLATAYEAALAAADPGRAAA